MRLKSTKTVGAPYPAPLMRIRAIIAALAVVALVVGCGATSSAPTDKNATLILDFTPNAIHAGIYSALARGFDSGEGVHLHVIAPSASTDSIKLLETGRADFAILDIHDLAIARERGKDIVGIMAIVERPLAAVLAAPAIHTPRQLDGKTVGVTGVPSDTAVLRFGRVGSRWRSGQGEDGDDRLQRRARAADRPRRRRHRVLERRGRDAAAAPPRLSRLPRRRNTALRPIPSSFCARPGRASTRTRAWLAPW